MSDSTFLATLARNKLYLDSDDECSSSTKAELLSSNLLSTPLSSSSELDVYLTKSTSLTSNAQAEVKTKKVNLLKSIDILLDRLSRQKAELASAPEEIEATEDSLMELCNQLNSTKNTREVKIPSPSPSTSASFRNSLEKQMSSLQQLYEARDYLAVLAKAENLALKAISAEEKFDTKDRDEAIDVLTELNSLANRIESVSIGKSKSLNLDAIKAIPFLKSQTTLAFTSLVTIRRKRLSDSLEEAGWPPSPLELGTTTSETQRATENSLFDSKSVRLRWMELMKLQRQSERLKIIPPSSSRLLKRSRGDFEENPKHIIQAGSKNFQPLFACQCLMNSILLRFYYHFDSNRSTNRLDKPEWYLTHMLNTLRSNAHLFEPMHGLVARLCYNKSSKYPPGVKYNLYAELLHAILRPLVVKLESSIPILLEHSSMLSHTIIQVVQFDQDLRDVLPVAESTSPIRLAEILLSNQTIFEAWVQSESIFTTERLHQEIESGSAWTIGEGDDIDEGSGSQQDSWSAMIQETASSTAKDMDSSEEDSTIGPKMKTTRSAQAVVSLLDGLTKRYQALQSLNLQLPFLLIQLSLLQGYAQRLDKSLDAFESMSSAFSRAIPGAIHVGGSPGPDVIFNPESDMVRGLRGLARLLKASLSAIYISRHLSDISSTSFYLEMGSQMHSDRNGLTALDQFRAWQGHEEERDLDKASLAELVKRGWKSSNRITSGLRPLGGASPKVQTENLPSNEIVSSNGQTKDVINRTDVWEDVRARFDAIASRSLKDIEKLVVSEVLDGLRSYAHRNWDEDNDVNEDSEEEGKGIDLSGYPTTALLPCLSLLSSHLTRLLPSLPRLDSNLVYRNIAYAICTALVDRVILAGGSHRFSELGSIRFRQDVMQGWISVIQDVAKSESSRLGKGNDNTSLGRKPEGPWKYLIDASSLLSLPRQASIVKGSEGQITLRAAVQAVFDQNDRSKWELMRQRLNIDDRMDIRLVQDILRRRIDSPR